MIKVKDVNKQNELVGEVEAPKQAESEEQQEELFWNVKNDKVSFNRAGLIRFLEERGFFKIGWDKATYQAVYCIDNIVEKATEEAMIDEVRQFLELNAKPIVVDKFLEVGPTIINQVLSKALDTNQPDFKRDTAEKCLLFYRNAVVEITKDGVKEMPYSELDGYVWRKQIMDRVFKAADTQKSEFEIFCRNVAGPKNFKALKSVIGYLIHRYKNPSMAKAIVLMDGALHETGEANGGTGKSLIVQGIKRIRNVVFEDGKTAKIKGNRFGFQLVGKDTEIVFIDDIRKDFELEALYAAITGEFVAEAKYEKRFSMPFEESPKFVLTSNYALPSNGNSDERRRVIVPVTDYYGAHRTPEDDFGHLLFDDWNEAEWQRFDAFMAECVQVHLMEGLIQPDMPDYREMQLRQNTNFLFPKFADENLKPGQKYDRKELLVSFKSEYPELDVSANKFGAWIKHWSKARRLIVHFTESNSKRWVEVKKPK
jgi:hypothetical protein